MKKILVSLKQYLNLDTAFAILALLTVFLSHISTIFKIYSISSLFFSASFVVLVLWLIAHVLKWIYSVYKGTGVLIPSETISTFLLICASLWMMFTLLYTTPFSSFSLDYFRKAIITLCFLYSMHLFAFSNFKSRTIKNVLCVGSMLFGLLILGSYFIGISKSYIASGLSLNYQNPNYTGLVLSSLALFLLYSFYYYKNVIIKLLAILIAIGITILNYWTRCRSGFIAILLIGICLIWVFRRINNKDKHGVSFNIVLVLFPLLILCIYMLVGERTNILAILDKYLGGISKSFSTRLYPWERGFTYFIINPALGSYYQSTIDSVGMLSGYQNGLFDVLIEQGIIFFIFFILAVINVFLYAYERVFVNRSLNNFLSYGILTFVIFSMIFDSGAILGLNGWYVMMFAPLSLFDGYIVKKPLKVSLKSIKI